MVNQLGDRTGTGSESGRIVKMLTAHSKTLTLSSLAHPVVFPTQSLDSSYYFEIQKSVNLYTACTVLIATGFYFNLFYFNYATMLFFIWQ